MIKTLFMIFLTSLSLTLQGQSDWMTPPDNPVELGQVKWLRNLDEAKKMAVRTGKNIFILFQEVPGCSTCTSYGQDILSHPLLVEAIEREFIPLCIYNNKKGYDAQVLKKFKEPSWNNPVVRIIDVNEKDIIPRLNGQYNLPYVIAGITRALRSSGTVIPEYLNGLEIEYGTNYHEETILGMFCFWSGEKLMSQIPGVVSSEAGFMSGREVVKISFDPSIISESQLITKAKNGNCADMVFSDEQVSHASVPSHKKGNFRKDRESKYYLYHSIYKSLPMTPYQQLQANAEIAAGGDISILLSERQLKMKSYLEKNPLNYNAIGKPIYDSWNAVVSKIKK